MIDVYEKTENAGMVSPGTRWGKVDYDFESYSDKYIKKMKDVKQEGFAGWCMLIKKERFEKIGYFCEDYEIGIGEDTDYYLELKKNGYQSLITGVAFVHHFGSMTLDDVKETKGDEWEKKNIDKMNDKWGIQKETYLARKINNLIRTINRFFIKLFHGHLLSEKRNVHRKRHSNKK
jgi:GT2 family glycosyltransferase